MAFLVGLFPHICNKTLNSDQLIDYTSSTSDTTMKNHKHSGKNEGYLVAVGKEEEIRKAWVFVQTNIAPTLTGLVSKADFIEYALGKFRSLALDEQLQTLPPEAQARTVVQNKRVDIDMDGDEFDSRFFYESGDITVVERDLNDLAREDSFFANNQHANLNLATIRSVIPKKVEIPESEKLLGMYSCSLWTAGSLPRLGRLYLTPNYVGFQSGQVLLFAATAISLRFTDIVHVHFFVQSGFECIQVIAKRDPFKSGAPISTGSANNPHAPGAMQSLSGFHTVAFATMTGGIQIFDEITKLWKLSMKKFQASESDKKRVREGEKKDEYLVTFEEAMKTKASDASSSEPLSAHSISRAGGGLVGGTVTSSHQEKSPAKNTFVMARKGLERLSDKVVKKFRLPESEVLLNQARATISVYARRGNSFIKSAADVVNVPGIVFVTTHFVCFMDDEMYRGSYLGAETGDRSRKALAVQKAGGSGAQGSLDESTDNLNDEAQTTAVLLAEWDVAAAEDEDGGDLSSTNEAAEKLRRQQEAVKNAKKKVPATSLATAEDAPPRLWCVIPLREVSRLKIGKPTSQVSTAYAEFGMAPHIVNLHLPHNMYAFTFINRPHMYDCLVKVHSRVQRQESRRNPLPCYSVDGSSKPAPLSPQTSSVSSPIAIHTPPKAAPSEAPGLSTSPGSPTFSFALLSTSSPNSSSQDLLEPPPRSTFFKHVTYHPLPSGDVKFPDSILNDSRQFASTYRARERLQEEKFLNYFHKYGQSSGLTRKGPELPILVRNGIPHSLRGHLWFTLSGASNRFMAAPKGYYQSILDKYAGVASVSVEQIERDLHRSMPTHPFYAIRRGSDIKPDPSAAISEVEASYRAQLPEYKPCQGNNIYHPMSPPENEPVGISRLRRVLVAYAWHNPVIAYCQSMNIVVAALLLYMSEEEAFYTLITLVEYLEEYWTREMMGAIVDMLVLKDVLKQKRPALVAHLETLQLDYSIAALPWFMCLFIGYVPMQLSLRLMDCFFYNAGQGKATSTLFQAAIALFTIAEEQLMECYDPVAVSNVFREVPYGVDCDKLISIVFSDDSLALRASILDELRNFHRYNAIQHIEAQNMEEEFMTLVYGRKTSMMPPRAKPAASTASDASASTAPDSSASSGPEKIRSPAPPPTTPVHFSLGDLKRLYFNFKDAVLSEQYQPSKPSQTEDATRIANSKSLLSSLNPAAFDKLFRQHMNWWPSSSDHLLPHIFVWMDISETNHLSFVDYVQGLDVLCYGNNRVVSELVYDLTANSTSLNHQVSNGLDKKNFSDAVKLIYTIMLYSKADPETIKHNPSAEPSKTAEAPKYVPRRKLDLDTVSATTDTLDDWLLLNADEAFHEVVSPEILNTLFNSYSDKGRISKDHFIICVTNQMNLVPPVTMADLQ